MVTDATDSVGEIRPLVAGVADLARILRGGRMLGGRIVGTFLPGGGPARGMPNIMNLEIRGVLCG